MEVLRAERDLFYLTDPEISDLRHRVKALMFHPGHEKPGIHLALHLLHTETHHRYDLARAHHMDCTEPQYLRQWYWAKTNKLLPEHPDGEPYGLDDDYPTNEYRACETCGHWKCRCRDLNWHFNNLQNWPTRDRKCTLCFQCQGTGIQKLECNRCKHCPRCEGVGQYKPRDKTWMDIHSDDPEELRYYAAQQLDEHPDLYPDTWQDCEECVNCTNCNGNFWFMHNCRNCTNGYEHCDLCGTPPLYYRQPIRANTGPPQWRIVKDSTWCSYGTRQHWVEDYGFLDAYSDGNHLLPELRNRWNCRDITKALLDNHYMTILYRLNTPSSEETDTLLGTSTLHTNLLTSVCGHTVDLDSVWTHLQNPIYHYPVPDILQAGWRSALGPTDLELRAAHQELRADPTLYHELIAAIGLYRKIFLPYSTLRLS